MPITRLNHAVLYVRNVEKSVAFYTGLLGFRAISNMTGAGRNDLPPSTCPRRLRYGGATRGGVGVSAL